MRRSDVELAYPQNMSDGKNIRSCFGRIDLGKAADRDDENYSQKVKGFHLASNASAD